MAFINFSNREVNCKVVYCGPGLSGKTTNIIQVYRTVRPDSRGRLVSLCTEMERTLYFDFLPLEIGEVAGFRMRFHLYSVPGQVFYGATRRLVFRGVDGVIFVADSAQERMDANREALRDFEENLEFYGIDFQYLPYVLQLNKRDLESALDVEYMTEELRLAGEPVYQAIAFQNEGVRETMKDLARQILMNLQSDLDQLEEADSVEARSPLD